MKILLNGVYVGGYGYNKNNLPHEMINFFKDDNGKFFVYITPYGTIDSNLKISDLDSILFVQSVKNTAGMVEVLAKAIIDHDKKDSILFTEGIRLNKDGATFKSKEDRKKYEDKYNKSNPIYAGTALKDIHEKNLKDNNIYATLQVSEICLPKTTFYLTNKEENVHKRANVFYIGDSKKIANQSMKLYFDSEDDIYLNEENQETLYGRIKQIIEDDKLWKSSAETPKCDYSLVEKDIDKQKNFFSITKQQDNEVMFSNMLYYMFTEYPDIVNKFIDEVLNLNYDNDIVIEREKDRMDVRLIGSKQYIIIENKINSPINGMYLEKDDADKDKTKYSYKDGYRAVDDKYVSQLDKYYKLAKEYNEKTLQRDIHGFILKPDYISIDKDFLSKYLNGDMYEPLNYSKVKKFLIDYLDKNNIKDMYLDEFCKAMQKHSEATDSEHRKVLIKRMFERINSCPKNDA